MARSVASLLANSLLYPALLIHYRIIGYIRNGLGEFITSHLMAVGTDKYLGFLLLSQSYEQLTFKELTADGGVFD